MCEEGNARRDGGRSERKRDGERAEREGWRETERERMLLSELHVVQGNIVSYRKRARASRWLRAYVRNAKPPLSLKRDSSV